MKIVDCENNVFKDQNYIHDPEEKGMLTQCQFLNQAKGKVG